jgi:hypothetical protein
MPALDLPPISQLSRGRTVRAALLHPPGGLSLSGCWMGRSGGFLTHRYPAPTMVLLHLYTYIHTYIHSSWGGRHVRLRAGWPINTCSQAGYHGQQSATDARNGFFLDPRVFTTALHYCGCQCWRLVVCGQTPWLEHGLFPMPATPLTNLKLHLHTTSTASAHRLDALLKLLTLIPAAVFRLAPGTSIMFLTFSAPGLTAAVAAV